MMNKKSGRFDLNRADVSKWLKNTLVFLAPALLVFLLSIQAGNSLEDSFMILQLWGINTVIDLLRKYIADNRQRKRLGDTSLFMELLHGK